MPHLLRTALALVAGLVTGSVVNMAIVVVGSSLVSPPAGGDTTTVEGLRTSMHLLEPKHFVVPFLAHALGTFAGALAGSLLAGSHRALVAYVIGAFFLLGGVAASMMIPAPAWFKVLDLVGAYLPMAWLALTVSMMIKPASMTGERDR